MMLTLVIAFAPPLIAGYLLVTALWPDPRSDLPDVLIRLSLAIGIGFGLSSCVFFIGLVIVGPTLLTAIISDLVLFIAVGTVYALCRPPLPLLRLPRSAGSSAERDETPDPVPIDPPWPGQKLLPWVFLIVVIGVVAGFSYLSAARPHGQWDAWAIWNLNARFIFRGGDLWTNLFTVTDNIPHPDYPMLLPATIARLWFYAGRDIALAPIGVGALFPAAALGLLVSGLWALKGRSQGLLAGVFLAASHRFVTQGSYQFADLPLSSFFLAVLVLLALWHERETAPHGLAVLIGVLAGLGAWIKNEGALFLIVSAGVILTFWFVRSIRRQPRLINYRRQMLMFLAGILPILAILIYYKLTYAPPNDIVSGQGWDVTIARLTDPARYMTTIEAFLTEGLRGSNNLGAIVFIAYLLLFGIRSREWNSSTWMLVMIIGLTVLGYFFIYIITPRGLGWHLIFSIDRLFMHLWPSVLFVFFLVVPSPGEALQK